MSFNPNNLLNNPANLISFRSQNTPKNIVPVPAPPYDKGMYIDAYSRLGLLNIANIADLGCGTGNFTGVMLDKHQRPEVYLGVDNSHSQISTAKAAYPGWSFIYGDFFQANVRQEYERYEAYLMLNIVDVLEDDLSLLEMVPSGKPVLFSLPRGPVEGSLRYFSDQISIKERYSSLFSIRSVGRYRRPDVELSMIVGIRW
jgi:SAM-dependent methyltransferase